MEQQSLPQTGSVVMTEEAIPTYRLQLRQRTNSYDDSVNRHVHWSSDTVDNEGLGRNKSKRCCIYHKPRNYTESSTESDTSDATNDTETDYDTDATEAYARRRERVRRRRTQYRQKYLHQHDQHETHPSESEQSICCQDQQMQVQNAERSEFIESPTNKSQSDTILHTNSVM